MDKVPNEILAKIIKGYVPLNDLKALRLSWKAISGQATIVFAQQFLDYPLVAICRESLEALIERCEHPLFGPYIRHIQFAPEKWDLPCMVTKAEMMARRIKRGLLKEAVQIGKGLQIMITRHCEVTRFEASGEKVALLSRVFQALGLHGTPIHVVVGSPPRFAKPLRRVYPADMDLIRAQYLCQGVHVALASLIEAISRTSCIIGSFGIAQKAFDDSCDEFLDYEQIKDKKIASGSLKHAAMNPGCSKNVYDSLGSETRDDRQPEATVFAATKSLRIHGQPHALPMKSLNRAAIDAINLEVLEVHGMNMSSISDRSWPLFDLFLNSISSRTVQDITLYWAIYSEKMLIAALGKQKHTLKKLVFRHVNLHGSWKRVLLWIRNNTRLKHFSISSCWQANSPRRYGDVNYNGEWQIRDGISALLEEGEAET